MARISVPRVGIAAMLLWPLGSVAAQEAAMTAAGMARRPGRGRAAGRRWWLALTLARGRHRQPAIARGR
ncbi:MAG: hypothetical protein IT318_15000 [Anaerolineales bacterium]|nr:hypothetical protein [Anaerolineales bacterium]